MHPGEVLAERETACGRLLSTSARGYGPRGTATNAVGVARGKVYRRYSIHDSLIGMHFCQLPRHITPVSMLDLLVRQCSVHGCNAPTLLQELEHLRWRFMHIIVANVAAAWPILDLEERTDKALKI